MGEEQEGQEPNVPGHSRRTLHAGLWSMVGTAVQFALTTLTLVASSRLVPVAAFGGLVAALSVITIFLTVVRLVVAQYVIQQQVQGDRLKRLQRRVVGMSAVVALAGCYWAPEVAGLLNVPEAADAFVILWISTVVVAFGAASVATLQRRLAFKLLTAIQVLSTALYAAVTIGLSISHPGVVALALGQAVLFASVGAFSWLALAREERRHPDASVEPSTVGDAPRSARAVWLPTSLMSLFVVGAQQVDNLITGVRLGTEGLSLYSRAYRLAAVPANLFSDAFSAVLFPAMADRQSSLETLRRVLYLGLVCILATTVPAAVLGAWDSQDIVVVTLGAKWAGAAGAAAFLFAVVPLRLCLKYCASVLQSRGDLTRMATGFGIYCGAVAVAVFVGTGYGVTGVGAGVCVATVASALVMYLLLGVARPTMREGWALAGIILGSLAVTAGARAAIGTLGPSGWALLGLDALVVVAVGVTPFLTTRGGILRAERAGIRALLGLDRLLARRPRAGQDDRERSDVDVR